MNPVVIIDKISKESVTQEIRRKLLSSSTSTTTTTTTTTTTALSLTSTTRGVNHLLSCGTVTQVELLPTGMVNRCFLVHLAANHKHLCSPQISTDIHTTPGTDTSTAVLKVINPCWTACKTINEVAVMSFIKRNTSIPVPEVYCYEANRNLSSFGYEYILMEKLEGQQLSEIWKTAGEHNQKTLVTELAAILDQLRQFKFNQIGSFDLDMHNVPLVLFQETCELTENNNNPTNHQPITHKHAGILHTFGEYVDCFLNLHLPMLESRGEQRVTPFIRRIYSFRQTVMQKSPDLNDVSPNSTVSSSTTQPPTVLCHGDFSAANILVGKRNTDGKYEVRGLLDWEWAMSAPEDVELHRGFGFLGDNNLLSYLHSRLKHKFQTEGQEWRSDVLKVERLVSRLLYVRDRYRDQHQAEMHLESYCNQLDLLLCKYSL